MPAPGCTVDLEAARDRRVIVGLSGGIACYKVANVVSALAQAGARVTVVMTEAATRFVGPLTFQALSGNPVYHDAWQHLESHDPQHIHLARAADLMLIAPATMDMLAKLAQGRADDVVSLVAAAMDVRRQPILLAPSMNEVMWNQPSTRRNVAQLEADGFRLIQPSSGWQACRTEGIGRLPEPGELLNAICRQLQNSPRN
jgi:phosphopantothenoylcysteine decarboxylase/phosphopantothenate--cysteine ligase